MVTFGNRVGRPSESIVKISPAMPKSRITRKGRNWVRSHPKVALAAVNLRSAGLNERRIYEQMRGMLKNNPSYRDLRAAFDRFKSTKGGRIRGQKGKRVTLDKRGRVKLKSIRSEYKKRVGDLSSPSRRGRLDRNFTVGYLIAEDVGSDDFKDRNVVEYLESEYEEGSP